MSGKTKYYLWALVLFACGTLQGQDVSVNLNMKHSVHGVSELDREKFFIIHHGNDDSDWDSDAQRKRFLEENDVYMGRSTGGISWNFRNIKEDPNKPGWPQIESIRARGAESRKAYAQKKDAHAFEDRLTKMVIGGQPLKVYPNGQKTPKGWAYANYDAVAEFYAHYLAEFYGKGGTSGPQKPKYLEVLNEPFVKAKKLKTTTANLSRFHSVVAKRVKQMHPEIKIGGYGAAHPAYQSGDFNHWRSRWKTFIDIAGEDMDFYSYHLYDNHKTRDALPRKRKGSNIEAIMDMIEHYSVLKHGKRKPVYITEFGYFLEEAVPYNKQSDWYQLRAMNSMLMQFMERQDILIGAIPFMILKAEWGRSKDGTPYGPRILRQKKEVPGYDGNGEDWVYTDLVKYYQFWKDLKGVRSYARSSNPDILTDAYVDGNKAYVLISNLSLQDRELQVAVHGAKGRQLKSVQLSHIHANEKDEAVWDKRELEQADKVTIGREATLILTYVYDKKIKQNKKWKETKYFANDYLQAIEANKPIELTINGVKRARKGAAMLRIGMGRKHDLSLTPSLLINGEKVAVPTNWRGDKQSARKEFFGVVEIPVPNKLIKKNNNIKITFADKGGHVSSVSMQYFRQSSTPKGALAY